MIARFLALVAGPGLGEVAGDVPASPAEQRRVREGLRAITRDPYFMLADERLGLLSVFDDLKYDRSDSDMLSPGMRRHAVKMLGKLGFRQISGTVLENAEAGMRALMPKSHALGASPFDIARYTPKGDQDFYLMTPTQVACQFIDAYPRDEALARIVALVEKHPINLLRLTDYLEKKPTHRAFGEVAGEVMHVQRVAVTSEPLRRRRAL